jgi:hypothetical protein
MEDPEISIAEVEAGDSCAFAVDVTSATFPYELVGQFDVNPTESGSCVSDPPANGVWFRYTAPSDGFYQVDLANGTSTDAYSYLTVFDGTVCSPLGTELGCEEAYVTSVSGTVYLTGGQDCLILFHTDGNSFTMVDPTISITPITVDPGTVCQAAADVTSASFPFVLTGTFDGDPDEGGSCDTAPTNAVWFRYTAPATTSYRIELANASTTGAYSRAAVFDGTGCSPLPTELACETAAADTITVTVSLVEAESYLILFHTDGDGYTMVDPSINITPMAVGPGTMCNLAADVTAETFPFVILGELGGDPSPGGSCDATPTNAAWYLYTPPQDGLYQLDLVNSTSSTAQSVLAVFETSSCSPLGTEISCTTAAGTSIAAQLSLTGGVSYLILFHTDGDSSTMLNPAITIAEVGPGDACQTAYDVSAESFPFVLSGQFDADPAVAGSCDTTPTNIVWFRYTPSVTDDYTITLVNASTTTPSSRLALFDGTSCSPLGSELSCTTTGTASAGTSVALTAGQPYLIAFYTDGNASTMVDPQITIIPTP